MDCEEHEVGVAAIEETLLVRSLDVVGESFVEEFVGAAVEGQHGRFPFCRDLRTAQKVSTA